MQTLDTRPQAYFRLRLNYSDTYYVGGLIPASTILRLFTDCSSELGARLDGSDGYLAAYEQVDFLKPLFAGDSIEVRVTRIAQGNRSRRTLMEAYRSMEYRDLGGSLSGGTFHEPPELVARAVAIGVRPRELVPGSTEASNHSARVRETEIPNSDVIIRTALGAHDTHYAGTLIPGAIFVRLLADSAAQLDIRDLGRPGMLAACRQVEFFDHLAVGDRIEVRADLVGLGNRSRQTVAEIWRSVRAPNDSAPFGDYTICDPPELVGRGMLITVAPRA